MDRLAVDLLVIGFGTRDGIWIHPSTSEGRNELLGS
jgi:hypothetical protein